MAGWLDSDSSASTEQLQPSPEKKSYFALLLRSMIAAAAADGETNSTAKMTLYDFPKSAQICRAAAAAA